MKKECESQHSFKQNTGTHTTQLVTETIIIIITNSPVLDLCENSYFFYINKKAFRRDATRQTIFYNFFDEV